MLKILFLEMSQLGGWTCNNVIDKVSELYEFWLKDFLPFTGLFSESKQNP